MNLYEILIPTVKNGKPIHTRYHKVWDKYVTKISKGLTILHPHKGIWVSPSSGTIEERMIPVRIACTESELLDIINFSLTYYDQEAIMAYEISNKVIILHRK